MRSPTAHGRTSPAPGRTPPAPGAITHSPRAFAPPAPAALPIHSGVFARASPRAEAPASPRAEAPAFPSCRSSCFGTRLSPKLRFAGAREEAPARPRRTHSTAVRAAKQSFKDQPRPQAGAWDRGGRRRRTPRKQWRASRTRQRAFPSCRSSCFGTHLSPKLRFAGARQEAPARPRRTHSTAVRAAKQSFKDQPRPQAGDWDRGGRRRRAPRKQWRASRKQWRAPRKRRRASLQPEGRILSSEDALDSSRREWAAVRHA